MATRAELEQARRALNRITAAANGDLRALLAEVDLTDKTEAARLLAVAYPALVAEYAGASAAFGADVAEMWAADLGVRPVVTVAPTLTAAQAVGVAGWALDRPDPLGNLAVITDQVVKQPYRDTLQASAHASNLAWARVPMGAETCAFCVMTASRGAVYRTSGSAGGDRKYHGDCDCQVTMVRTPEDYPEGYEPSVYYDIYAAGWDIAKTEAGTTSTKAVLAGMRQFADLH